MKKWLVLLMAFLCVGLAAETHYASADPDLMSAGLTELIDISGPIFLDIQAGDLTPTLDLKIRGLLLDKGADLRETDAAGGEAYFYREADSTGVKGLAPYALRSANLVSITLDLGSTTVESKGFLTYRSERHPLYTFQVKQIEVPGYRLKKVDELSFVDMGHKDRGQTVTNIKWFEPVLMCTALASLIYLLWTTE
jgi:hypothetical protein